MLKPVITCRYTWLVVKPNGPEYRKLITYMQYVMHTAFNPFYSSDVVFITLSFTSALASGNKNDITLVSGFNYTFIDIATHVLYNHPLSLAIGK